MEVVVRLAVRAVQAAQAVQVAQGAVHGQAIHTCMKRERDCCSGRVAEQYTLGGVQGTDETVGGVPSKDEWHLYLHTNGQEVTGDSVAAACLVVMASMKCHIAVLTGYMHATFSFHSVVAATATKAANYSGG
jgi:hypothetical protein